MKRVLMLCVAAMFLGCGEDEPDSCVRDGGSNLVINGDLSSGLECLFVNQAGQLGRGFSLSEDHPPQTQAPALRVVNETAGNLIYDTQLISQQFLLESGKSYRVSFWARADEARTVDVWVQACCDVSIQFFQERINLTTEWQQVERTFTAGTTVNDAYFEIQFGEVSTSPVYVDDMVVEPM